MSEAYGAFAYAYDQALGARFFKAARRLLDETFARYPTSKRTHLDVACGTGLIVEHFRRRGWKSFGVDASLPMLAIADDGVCGDMRQLPFRGRFARVTCLYDSLNHLLDVDDLTAAFRAIRGVMDPDSLFLFDVNHPDIYPEVWGLADPFVSTARDHHLEIATTYQPNERLARASVSGWAVIDGKKMKIAEQHRQRAYNQREITEALAQAGLAPVDVMDFDPYGEAHGVDATTVKLFFVVRPI